MERDEGADKDEGKCSQLEGWESRVFASATTFPDFPRLDRSLKLPRMGPERSASGPLIEKS